jgi:hypothetical protein
MLSGLLLPSKNARVLAFLYQDLICTVEPHVYVYQRAYPSNMPASERKTACSCACVYAYACMNDACLWLPIDISPLRRRMHGGMAQKHSRLSAWSIARQVQLI